jgi:hypothetical protein
MSSDGAPEAIALEPVDALTVTTLVDNVTDSLLPDQGLVKRPSMTAAPRIAARFAVGGDTDDALRAEHGFSALVTVEKASTSHPPTSRSSSSATVIGTTSPGWTGSYAGSAARACPS